MASPTKKKKVRKALKVASRAKRRKNKIRNQGSTAQSLPLNMPNAQERAVKNAA